MKQYKIIVEKHPDGYVAYPLGLKGVVVGQGDTYEDALSDVKSAVRFHIATFGEDVFEIEPPILEAFVAEAGVQYIDLMFKFPVDAPKQRVIKSFELLGFQMIREKEHISMKRANPDGTNTLLTMPNHPKIKASTLRTICTQAGIARDDFLKAYDKT